MTRHQQAAFTETTLRLLAEDMKETKEALKSLTETVSDLQISMARHKGMFGGISLTIACVWAFFTFLWDKLRLQGAVHL